MADQKISELTALTGVNLADVDAFAVVDTSAVQTKKITYGELKAALDTGTGFVRITGDTMTGALGITFQLATVSTMPLSKSTRTHSTTTSSRQQMLELKVYKFWRHGSRFLAHLDILLHADTGTASNQVAEY